MSRSKNNTPAPPPPIQVMTDEEAGSLHATIARLQEELAMHKRAKSKTHGPREGGELYRVKEKSMNIPLINGGTAKPGETFKARDLLGYPAHLKNLLELKGDEERIEEVKG